VAFGEIPARALCCPAPDAIHLAWATVLLRALPPIPEKLTKRRAEYEDRLSIIDGRKALLDPDPNGVLVDREQPGDFFDRIVSMKLDQPIIEAAAHSGDYLPLVRVTLPVTWSASASVTEPTGGEVRASAHARRSDGA